MTDDAASRQGNYRPFDQMTLSELQGGYKNLHQAMYDGEISALEDEEDWERYHDMWDELVERADVGQPECPECGARDWAQEMDGPIYCRDCHFERPSLETRNAVRDAWEKIMGDV